MPFQKLISHPQILKAVADAGHTQPTPIQNEAIGKILQGSDLCASSHTGSGKTAAFILPALQQLASNSPLPGKGPRVLILVPTRELAEQVTAEVKKYGKYLPKTTAVCVYGGTPYPPQIQKLSKHYDILVATPGRLLDHIEKGRIQFSRTELFILDEADRMLDMGFIQPVEEIADLLPKKRQTLLFSATLKKNIVNLSKKLLHDPLMVIVKSNKETEELIDECFYRVNNIQHKYGLLNHLLQNPEWKQIIVFTATKQQADLLARKLTEEGHQAAPLHGDMNQRQRTRTMMRMRNQEVRILVATDVAARGIDILTISHIINFDLPKLADDYLHRIGRTGRANNKGAALSFVAARDMDILKKIERASGRKMKQEALPADLPAMKSCSFEKEPKAASQNFRKENRFWKHKKSTPKYSFHKKRYKKH